MEVTPFMIYIVGMVDRFVALSSSGAFLSFVALFPLIIVPLSNDEDIRKIPALIAFFFFLIFSSLALFTPGSKTLASMYVIPAVVNNEKIQNIGKNGLESLELLTKQWVKELREDAEKEDE